VTAASYNTFQPTHPHSEIEFMIARDKEMYVIGHYHVAPNHHVMTPPSWHNLRMQHGRGRWPKLFGGVAQSVTKNKGGSYLWNMRSSRNG